MSIAMLKARRRRRRVELNYERRLCMAASCAAGLFDHVAMFYAASLLRELADAANFGVRAGSPFLEAE